MKVLNALFLPKPSIYTALPNSGGGFIKTQVINSLFLSSKLDPPYRGGPMGVPVICGTSDLHLLIILESLEGVQVQGRKGAPNHEQNAAL